ncbi:MAG: AMP-binding protein [Desulfobacteraceae bacterium]|nr:AMP-binding protein [Desulfobacteraceae bacterium]
MAGLIEEQGEIRIRMEQDYRAKGDTWPKILKYNYEKYGHHRRAMRHKHYGIWQPHTWKDYYLNVKYLALGLLTFGFEPGDKVLIIGDNAPHWYYAELAAQANHGVSVGSFSDLLPLEIKYIAENSEARFVVVEGQEQVDKLLQIKHALPLLKKVIFWNYKGLAHYDEDILVGYREALTLGETYEAEHPGRFEQNVETGKADDICAIIFTAGTTGAAPKGAVHTYQTLRAGADYLLQLDPWSENDNVVPYLPPVWINEQWSGIGCHLLSAGTLNFAEAPETQQRDSRETGPSIVSYGARLWESQAAMVQARILGADVIKRFAFRLLMPIGDKAAELRYRKQKPSLFRKMLYSFADIILFRSIKRSLGLSNARICYTTGAILSPDAFRFYHALNLPLKSLYGTTEGGALTGAGNDDIYFDTIGPAHRGAEARIGETGELSYRQPGIFLGYYRDPERTASVLKGGWFFSGDSGFIREDQHIVFEDRVRDLVKLDSGDTLAPQNMESRLRFSPYIKDVWVLAGPENAYVSAIIVIDNDNVSRWAGQKKLAFTSFAELSQAPEVYELVRQDIDRVNHTVPAGSWVRKYANLHKEFDPDEGELTRTRNLRRAFLEERYRKLIDAIYSEKAVAPIEAQVRYHDGRTATIKTTINIESV